MRFFGFPVFGELGNVSFVVQLFFYNHVTDRVEHGHVRARAELQHVGREFTQANAARIHDDQLAAAFGELLKIRRRNRVVFDGVGPDDDRHICVFDFIEGRRHGAGTDVFHQCRHG